MRQVKIGKVLLTYGGEWNATTGYAVLTYVLHGGDGWWNVTPCVNSEPSDSNPVWVRATNVSALRAAVQALVTNAQQLEAAMEAAEALRVSAETSRAQAEASRVSAESSRASAESARVNSENSRSSAESSRVSAESSRVSAETARVSAENSRVSAETSRETASTQAVTAANTATAAANAAAASATSATAQLQDKLDTADLDHEIAEADHSTAASDHTATQQAIASIDAAAVRTTSQTLSDAQKAQARTNIGAASSAELADLDRDLGAYAPYDDVTLEVSETGKRYNSNGELVTDANWNVGVLGSVVVGNTYELKMESSSKMVLGTALFVAHTTEQSGSTTREVYTPLFSAMSTDIPASGYICFEAMEAYADVLVCYRTDVTGANVLKVRRYGTKASIATQINNLKKRVDLKSFADGYYQGMRVGTSDDLAYRGDATSEEFTSRKTGGSNSFDDGYANVKLVKGNSSVWNQFLDKSTFGNSQTINGVTFTNNGDGSITMEGTASARVLFPLGSATRNVGHTYLIAGATNNTTIRIICFGSQYGVNAIATITEGTNNSAYIDITSGTVVDRCTTKPLVIDLTKWYNGNVPSGLTAEKFLALNPQVATMAYNSGEIVNMTAEGITTANADNTETSTRSWKDTINRYFPNGMAKAGSAYDEMGATKSVKRVGKLVLTNDILSRLQRNQARQFFIGSVASGNISSNGLTDTSYSYSQSAYSNVADRICIRYSQLWVSNDTDDIDDVKSKLLGKTIFYELGTPEEYTYDELNLAEKVWENGTESIVVPTNGKSAPLRADIAYPVSAYKTVFANKSAIASMNSKQVMTLTDTEVAQLRALINTNAAMEGGAE